MIAGIDTATVSEIHRTQSDLELKIPEEVPQLLPALTETVPPAAPEVAVILVVEDVPAQPLGRDQV